jgi:hypothetical protein
VLSVFKDHPPETHFQPAANARLYHLFAILSSKKIFFFQKIVCAHQGEQAFFHACQKEPPKSLPRASGPRAAERLWWKNGPSGP